MPELDILIERHGFVPELVEAIIDDALPRAAQRASWWDTARAPDERMPQREACIAAGYVATRLGDGVRFRRADARRPRFR